MAYPDSGAFVHHSKTLQCEPIPQAAASLPSDASTAPESGPGARFFGPLAACKAALAVADIPRALEHAGDALASAGHDAELAESKYWIAKCHYMAGEIDVAILLAAESCAAAVSVGEPALLARAQILEARCLESAGEVQAALDLVILALEVLEDYGRVDDEARTVEQSAVLALGVVYLHLDELELAMQNCLHATELARQLPDPSTYCAAQDTVACVLAAQAAQAREAGDRIGAERLEREAIARSQEAVEIARQVGHAGYETSALLNLAESLTLVGEAPEAMRLLRQWESRYAGALPRHSAHLQDSLGQIFLAMDRPDEAVLAFEQALEQCHSEPHRAVIMEHLSQALERCQRLQEALDHYRAFHRVHARMSTERARRSARVAALRVDIEKERARARKLASSNDELRRRAGVLERQANEDVLTRLPNRRRVEAFLEGEFGACSAALIDVDNFKQVNDRFSHAIGDAVLQQLAGLMRDNIRPGDLAGRIGGEEFVVLFKGGPNADPLAASERLRRAIAGFDWTSVAPGLVVTVSIGLARAGEAGTGPLLLEIADQRLYAAKRAGRNRVVG